MTIKASSYPTSRPTLDLNFAQTKRLDPRVTFTRSSTGSYFDANGVLQSAATNTARFDHNPATGESLGLLVEESRANLATYSEHFDSAAWTKTNIAVTPNSALAPDNTFTADLIAGNGASGNHWLFNNTNDSSAGTRTYSIYAKANTHNFIQVLFSGDGGPYANFNLTTGIVGNTGTSTTASIQAVGNGWYRCIVYTSSASATTPYVALVSSATAARAESNSLSTSVYLWAAQSEFSASFPTSYIPTPATFTSRASSATYYDASGVIQTAGTNVARSAAFFPDSNGVMRSAGLLLEAAGTNLLQYSEQINTSPWTLNNSASVSANSSVAPDGQTTADTLSGTSTSSYAEQVIPWTASGNWSLSFFAKAGTSTRSKVYIVRSGSQVHGTNIDWSSGVPSFNTTFGCTTQSQKIGNGWYRISLLLASVVHTATNYLAVTSDFTSGTGTVLLWGFQAEESPYPTSYIATTTATVTRSADVSSSATVTRSGDVAQIAGTNFSSWYNQTEGTIYQNCTTRISATALASNAGIGVFMGGAGNVQMGFVQNATTSNLAAQVYTGTTYSANLTLPGAWTQNAPSKAALAYKQDSFAASASGAAPQTDTSGTVPIPNVLDIGQMSTATYNRIGAGTFARLTYWPTRLSDATLQAITQ